MLRRILSSPSISLDILLTLGLCSASQHLSISASQHPEWTSDLASALSESMAGDNRFSLLTSFAYRSARFECGKLPGKRETGKEAILGPEQGRFSATTSHHVLSTSLAPFSTSPSIPSPSHTAPMAIQTALTKALSIRVPVVQGGMMWVGLPELAAAVSNAGGLGILTGLTQTTPEALRTAIRETRKLTAYPFGVNLSFLPSINSPPYADFAQVIIDEGIPVCETAGGPSAAPIIQMMRKLMCM